MERLSSATSQQIKYCRILCILLMTYVHLPPGATSASQIPSGLFLAQGLLSDVLGRASVSALSFISGYLIVHSLQRKSALSLIKERFVSLLLPMAFWNLAIILFGLALLALVGEKISVISGLEGLSVFQIVADRIFSLHYGAASDSHNFLRDIFVCVMLARPLYKLIQRISFWLIPVLLIIDTAFSFQPIIMRGMILVFFAAGMTFADAGPGLKSISLLRWPALASLGLVLAVQFGWLASPAALPNSWWFQMFMRIALSILAIDFARLMAERVTSAFIEEIDSATYLIFLSHNVGFEILWGVWQLAFGRVLAFPYILFYLLAPLVWAACVVATVPVLERLPAWIKIAVAGRRSFRRHYAAVPQGT